MRRWNSLHRGDSAFVILSTENFGKENSDTYNGGKKPWAELLEAKQPGRCARQYLNQTSPMKLTTLTATAILAALPFLATAQTTVVDPTRQAGEREITLGGSGASNQEFDDSFGGVNFSYGWYTTSTALWSIRQSINYSNPSIGGTRFNGSTRVAFDMHLAERGPVRPFVGVNVGGVYGDNVRDTFAAGLEAGAKFYVQSRTFVYALVEYGWFFRNARNVDDTFRDGQFTWSVGVGFNF